MATRRANGIYYVKRNFPGLGKVYKSLGTRNKGRAQVLEAMLVSLHGQGRVEPVRAFLDGEVTVEGLAEYYETGRLHELTAKLGEQNSPLMDACTEALRLKAPDVKAGTLEVYKTGLAHFRRFAGLLSVREALTTDRIQEFKAFRLEEGVAHETINNDLIAVSILATHALRRDWIDKRPELSRFATKIRINYIESDQLAPYMASVRRQFRPLFQLLVGSGMRLGEAEALRVCDLRMGGSEARAQIRDSKTESGVRNVFIPAWAAEALRTHIEERELAGTDRLFTMPRRTTQKEHSRACKLAGIHGYTIHDHRHTAAVHLARAGMPLNLLMRQLGHSTIKMTMRYAAFHPEYSDVEKYFERVGETLGLGSPGNRSGNTPKEEVSEPKVLNVP